MAASRLSCERELVFFKAMNRHVPLQDKLVVLQESDGFRRPHVPNRNAMAK